MRLAELFESNNIASKVGFNDDGTITVLHGTTTANAELIKKEGFKASNPAGIAAMVEKEYKLPKDSVLKNHWYQFPMGRSDLDHIHFTSDPKVAVAYTVPEQLQDALTAAYRVLHPEIADMKWGDVQPNLRKWINTEGKRLTKPEILAVKIPWKAVGQHAFGRVIDDMEEYKKITDGEPPRTFAIPLKSLKDAKIIGSYSPVNENVVDKAALFKKKQDDIKLQRSKELSKKISALADMMPDEMHKLKTQEAFVARELDKIVRLPNKELNADRLKLAGLMGEYAPNTCLIDILNWEYEGVDGVNKKKQKIAKNYIAQNGDKLLKIIEKQQAMLKALEIEADKFKWLAPWRRYSSYEFIKTHINRTHDDFKKYLRHAA